MSKNKRVATPHICMVLADNDFPPDIRVEKEARALTAAGYRITILCPLKTNRPRRDEWAGCTIVRLPSQPLMRLRLNLLCWFITRHDRHWARAIQSIVDEEKVDALHVHDLPLVGTALAIGKRRGLPVIADLHENYPAMIRVIHQEHPTTWRRRILNYPPRWEADEKRWTRAATHVLVVVQEARDRLIGAGTPAERITVVDNTEDLDRFGNQVLDQELLAQYRDEFVISYVGGIEGPHRGVQVAVHAMPEILAAIPNARLMLVGAGDHVPNIEALVAECGLADRVTFTGWQPFHMVPSYIALSSVCLVPYLANPHTESTSPHKLMQYMLMSKPVVVSTCRPLERVIQETRAGLVFESGDSHALAQAVIRLQDQTLRDRLGEAGRRAVVAQYNWQAAARKLVGVYEQLHLR